MGETQRAALIAALESLLLLGCTASTPSAPPPDAPHVPAAGHAAAPSAAPAPLPPPGADQPIDYHQVARARLGTLQREMHRVALRLEREGTEDQRARWRQELGDIEHDRALLAMELQLAEQTPAEEWLATHGLLALMIDTLYGVGARTAVEIDRTIDAERLLTDSQ